MKSKLQEPGRGGQGRQKDGGLRSADQRRPTNTECQRNERSGWRTSKHYPTDSAGVGSTLGDALRMVVLTRSGCDSAGVLLRYR